MLDEFHFISSPEHLNISQMVNEIPQNKNLKLLILLDKAQSWKNHLVQYIISSELLNVQFLIKEELSLIDLTHLPIKDYAGVFYLFVLNDLQARERVKTLNNLQYILQQSSANSIISLCHYYIGNPFNKCLFDLIARHSTTLSNGKLVFRQIRYISFDIPEFSHLSPSEALIDFVETVRRHNDSN